MYKTIVLVLVCLCCFLASCRSTRQDSQNKISTTESSILQKETYRDTVLFTPKTETSLKIPVTELVFKSGLNGISKPKKFTQKNGNATAKIRIEHDTVTITATCDSLAIVARIKQELQREITTTARSDTQNNTKKTGYSFIDVIRAFLVGLAIGASVIFFLKTFKII
ncbi:hypothetical protein SGQ83_01375 [Flavobacterium sp. Fl-318]|uniref:Lipoprotein n=1 Tax=Flavobacterium cupriresistens TaxID=2893885 RepID=A0ABU4R5W8_9FLAO|nr:MULTISPECIES: hypothetical protein [unclassified Flavobacterium]MDX6187986.1 hypothetical protein [Flavobacterium sp. Fl-318]UFH42094.1 hypothetical protein LNP23_20075 [Flavobacterium sp. F-323]